MINLLSLAEIFIFFNDIQRMRYETKRKEENRGNVIGYERKERWTYMCVYVMERDGRGMTEGFVKRKEISI